VDFELSDDEAALADGIRSLCRGRFSLDRIRAAEDAGGHVDAGGWTEMADAGVFSLQVPEAAGGIGLGLAAAAVVFEELGRALVPGPLLATHLAAGIVDGAADGKVVVGAVRRPGGPAASATAAPVLVPHLPDLGALVMVGEDELTVADAGELNQIGAVALERSLDPLTPLWRIGRLPAGRRIGGPDEARDWRRRQCVLAGAVLVGLATGAMELAVAYAKQREQFGRPIGSFQAVKHLCADMLVAAETARAAVHAAAVTSDEPDVGDPERSAAGAGLLAAEAALRNGKTSIQVHGGMGFTWEVPAHLYLMRARVLADTIGPLDDLARRVAELY